MMKVLVLLLLGWAGASMADKDHPSCKTTVEACHAGCSADASHHDCTEKHTLGGVSVYCCHRPAKHCWASRDDAARHCKAEAATVHKCYEYAYCCKADQCPVVKQERRRIANPHLDAKRAAEEAKGTWSGALSSWWNGDGVTEEPPASHPPHAAKKTSGRKLRLVEEGAPTRKSNLKMAVAPPQRPTNHKKSSEPGYLQQAYNALDGQLSKIPGLRDGDPGWEVARIERRN